MANGHVIGEGNAVLGTESGLKIDLVAFDYESGQVLLTVRGGGSAKEFDGLVYLDAQETMKLSKHLRALAIRALEGD